MAIERIHIDKFLELAEKFPAIDVRSPGEFNHARFPGSFALPLFTDEERKIVGTTYKQKSREEAIKTGLDFFGPRMRKMVEDAEEINRQFFPDEKNKTVLVYCWRGGMRSAGVAWLLDLYGFKVYTLVGGYKKFRNWALNIFRQPFEFKILGGYTGSGKSEMLKKFEKNGEAIVDLESIANHKGSAFGGLGMATQPTQEMFENLLALELSQKMRSAKKAIWLEDESQRIGDVNIPHELWKTMRKAPVFFLDLPFEERLKHIVEEYSQFEKDSLLNCITRIERRLGGLETKNAIRYLEENNYIESFRILLKYYDKWYFKSLHNREGLNTLLTIISYDEIENLQLPGKVPKVVSA